MAGEERPAARDAPTAAYRSRLSIIVAMAKNRVIGAGNRIPWHLPNELKLFKSITMGHHLIMGRRTFESIGRLLPGRTTVIVTRRRDYQVPGALIAHSLEEAVAACNGDDEVFVIGGGELYRSALPRADRVYLTVVNAEPAGDTFMPEIDLGDWHKGSSQSFPADETHRHAYEFAVYDRVRD